MDIKEKVLELAKLRGLEIAESAAKELALLSLDVLKLVVKESENLIDDVVLASLEGKIKEMIEGIDL
jgi:hypothetical protein